jgi:flavin-dependent thymidylate synthase
MTTIRKWADEQQFVAPPMEANRDDRGMIVPRVTLLWMTPDPLGANAAMGRMYKGIPTYSMADITDDERKQFFADSMATHLKAPLEAIKFHFFIEGVTRSFTHQMVRQRTAVYAQESMRFAVKENMADELSLPPSIAELPVNHPTRQKWDEAVAKVSDTYNFLVANGIPAEDARGLAPHATTTRLNYVTDLRNLSEHAGNRLCTQAQFE